MVIETSNSVFVIANYLKGIDSRDINLPSVL